MKEPSELLEILYFKSDWTLSQSVFAARDKMDEFQDPSENKYFADQSFFHLAVQIKDLRYSNPAALPFIEAEAELYLKADQCIRAGALVAKWVEEECDYRIKRWDFVKWVVNQDIEIGPRFYSEIPNLIRKKTSVSKERIKKHAQMAADWIHIMNGHQPASDEIISILREHLPFLPIDKTLRNYLGEMKNIPKRGKGRPRKSCGHTSRTRDFKKYCSG